MALFPVTANTAKITSVASPTGGLNAYANLAAMPSTDAIRIVNMVPNSYGCTTRRGTRLHTSGMTGNVESLASRQGADGTTLFLAVAGAALYDVTTAGAVGAPLLSGLNTSVWQSVQFANAAGTHLVMFSGADNPIWYSNAGLARLTAGDGIATGTWSGIDPAKLCQGVVHQRRLWAVERDSTFAWFLPADSVYGVANSFDFGPFFRRGGYLAALGTWSADLGQGSDDNLVAISSEGEAVVFAGTDVAVSTSWSLRGTYYIGAPPAGRRFLTNIAGDLMLITMAGIVSMATVLTSTKVDVTSDSAYSRKVQYLLSNILQDVGSLAGWEIQYFPEANLLYINIPTVYQGGNGQLVANYINGSWCTFAGMHALTWCRANGRQFYGSTDGRIYEGWVGNRDNMATDGSGGTDIRAACQQAYSDFQMPAAQKQIGIYRPNFLSTQNVQSKTQLAYDYRTTQDMYAAPGAVSLAGSLWSQSYWDMSTWGGEMQAYRSWNGGLGMGTAVSLTLSLTATAEITWVSTDYTYRVGGPL